jgi:hypothetical protein
MSEFNYATFSIQIVTLIATLLTPLILAISVAIRHIKKSKCGCCECLSDKNIETQNKNAITNKI